MTTADDDRLALEEQLAAEPLDNSDLALLNSLRAYYDEHDPVPDGLVERIQFELTLDALHAEVATLTQLDLATAGARSTETESVRTITFTSESMTTMVTITPEGEGSVRVDGWAAPGAGIRVEILLANGVRETYADADGRFVFEQVPTGLAKFALHPADGESTTVVSPTMELQVAGVERLCSGVRLRALSGRPYWRVAHVADGSGPLDRRRSCFGPGR